MPTDVSLQIPYLTKQIIAYIGNKRTLLNLIKQALHYCLGNNFNGYTFLDLFSGSGVVARLAKYSGFQVYANEPKLSPYLDLICSKSIP